LKCATSTLTTATSWPVAATDCSTTAVLASLLASCKPAFMDEANADLSHFPEVTLCQISAVISEFPDFLMSKLGLT
jgi:hypothetical protein